MNDSYPDYITDATNRIVFILSETVKPSPEDLRRISSLACNTLQRVIARAEVSRDLAELAKRQKMYAKEFKEICGNVAHFVNGFCNIEEEVLIAAGFKEVVARLFLEKARGLRESIMNQTINPEETLINIKNLQDEACAIAHELHNFPIRQQMEREFRTRVVRIGYGIGGIAIVAINAGSLAATLGLSAPGSAVSGALGGGFIGAAVAI